MNIRRVIVTATVAGAIAVLPLTLIATNATTAGVVGSSKIVTIQGGQGNWPLAR